MPPRVSVVIATMSRPELLAQCVAAIAAGDLSEFEAIVVDQSQDDRSRRAIEERIGHDPRVRYVHSDIVGSSHARNVGLALSTAPIVACVDDDAVPVPGWLSAYARAFEEIRPAPGMVGGRTVLAWNGPRPRWYPVECKFILGTYDLGDEVREFPRGDLPISANFALRRDLLSRIEGFDTTLGFSPAGHGLLAAEDSHLALKVLNAGARIYYHPDAQVFHQVTAHKLSRRYFLRRFYWHGRAVVKLRVRPDGERRSWIQMWQDRRRKARDAPPAPRAPRQGLESRLMLGMAYLALAAGVAVEYLATMTWARQARTGEPGGTR